MEQRVDNLLEEFTLEQVDELNKIIEKYKAEPGGLIPLLEEAQALLGYLPITVQKQISDKTNIPLSRIYGVATFYSFFTMIPRGKHTVKVCLGTACYVKGGKEIKEIIEKEFGVKTGEITSDRMFTYETVRCLGVCGLAPVIVVDGEVYAKVKFSKVKEILEQYK
ncbi:NAD(P)H-dependent oxidoreductase subunit E [Candidatus Atribacteria bacterium 1244-E10-H5-B2]|jgi:NADH:ubiquinone oxidoreductase subunit E|nr:MAG: NAD(P)H-dependent oxidoreductase subunit E [Candidatus Atribacteria bacterium 1244-E10-H5-B2]